MIDCDVPPAPHSSSAGAGEPESNLYFRLRWRCRRGMLELDLLLQNFLDTRFASLPESSRADFERLLNAADADLAAWLTGANVPPDNDLKEIVAIVRG